MSTSAQVFHQPSLSRTYSRLESAELSPLLLLASWLPAMTILRIASLLVSWAQNSTTLTGSPHAVVVAHTPEIFRTSVPSNLPTHYLTNGLQINEARLSQTTVAFEIWIWCTSNLRSLRRWKGCTIVKF